jgi:hypothetical protein
MAKFHEIEPLYLAWHCPGCEGGHAVPVTGHRSGRGWGWNGSLESPTLTPSVLVNVGRANPTAHLCHVFITNGKIQFLGDCTHALANQTVEIPDWDE